MRKLLIPVLALLLLACNMPNILPSGPTPTPAVYVTVVVATPTPEPDATSTPESGSSEPTQPSLTPTATLSVTVTPTATATLTPTATPSGPTATPTLAPHGDPLGFGDPGWELKEWHHLEGTGDWEGTIKINVVGGVPPYRSQLEDNEIVEGTEVPARWRLCKVMPATVRVWSADGQEASTSIWIGELGCAP